MSLPERIRFAKAAAILLCSLVGAGIWAIPLFTRDEAALAAPLATLSEVLVVSARPAPPSDTAAAIGAAAAAASVASAVSPRRPAREAGTPERVSRVSSQRVRTAPRRERGVVVLGLRFMPDGRIRPAAR